MVELTTNQIILYATILLVSGFLLFYIVSGIRSLFRKGKEKKEELVDPQTEIQIEEEDPYKTISEKKKPKKKLQKLEEPTPIKHQEPDKPYPLYNPIKTKRSKWLIAYWIDWYRERFHLSKVALVNMELANGFHRTFLIKEKDGGFMYNKKEYVLDPSTKYWNMDARLYTYDFHENISLSIGRKLPAKDIKDTWESIPDTTDIDLQLNPSVLRAFIDGEIARQVLKSRGLDERIRRIQTMSLITMIIVIIVLVLILETRGVFQGLV